MELLILLICQLMRFDYLLDGLSLLLREGLLLDCPLVASLSLGVEILLKANSHSVLVNVYLLQDHLLEWMEPIRCGHNVLVGDCAGTKKFFG